MASTDSNHGVQTNIYDVPGVATNPEDLGELARARNTDPSTSHAAAASVNERGLGPAQEAVWKVLGRFGPCTDVDLVAAYTKMTDGDEYPKQSESGIRTRRKELARAGFVVDTGEKRQLPSGRNAILWDVIEYSG